MFVFSSIKIRLPSMASYIATPTYVNNGSPAPSSASLFGSFRAASEEPDRISIGTYTPSQDARDIGGAVTPTGLPNLPDGDSNIDFNDVCSLGEDDYVSLGDSASDLDDGTCAGLDSASDGVGAESSVDDVGRWEQLLDLWHV